MALLITDECINCDVCEPECPNGAISMGPEIYHVIDPDQLHRVRRATSRSRSAAEVCPVDCIPLHPDYVETREQLQTKYEALTAAAASKA
jgi:NAD-dependent dihydropyrimidine dehydrogenase PreA subunit